MSVSELPISKDDEARRRRHRRGGRGSTGQDKWSVRLRLLIVVFAGLALCSGILLVASWLF